MSKYYYTYSQDKIDNLLKETKTELNTSIANVESTVVSTASDVALHTQQIETLQTDVKNNTSNINNIDQNIDGINTTINKLELQINNITSYSWNKVDYGSGSCIEATYGYYLLQIGDNGVTIDNDKPSCLIAINSDGIYVNNYGESTYGTVDECLEYYTLLNPSTVVDTNSSSQRIPTCKAVQNYVSTQLSSIKSSPFALYKEISSTETYAYQTGISGTYLLIPSSYSGANLAGSSSIGGTRSTVTVYSPIVIQISSSYNGASYFYTPSGAYYVKYNLSLKNCKLYSY